MRKHEFAQMIVVSVILSVIGVAFALAIDWFPTQAASQADDIDTLYDVLLIFSVPVFVLVEMVVLFSVWKFRMRPGQEETDGPPIHGSTTLEVVWTIVPTVLIAVLCVWAYVVLQNIEEAPASGQEMIVDVSGEQFTWRFSYPQPDGAKPIASTQLYLPKDKPVLFKIHAKDVLHSFWVPAFRIKRDAVPGITTEFRVTPNRLGTYPVVCAELCGIGHAAMRQTAHIVTQARFEQWLAEKQAPVVPEGATPTEAGKALYTSPDNGCGACHKLADAGSGGAIGPDLDQSLKGKDEAYVRAGIADPDAVIAEGFSKGIMPTTYSDSLSDDELDALTSYLVTATQGP